jgi:hypothetical protein
MTYADDGRAPDLGREPAHTPAQVQARIRALAFKSLDIADGILERLKAEQGTPEPPALPLTIARRQTVNLLGVPTLCHHRRCKRAKVCTGEPSHCLTVNLHALPHELLARVLSTKAMRQRSRRK